MQAKLASPRLEKWIGAAALEWEKSQGEIPLDEMDTQEKTDSRDTNRFLLSHGKGKCGNNGTLEQGVIMT